MTNQLSDIDSELDGMLPENLRPSRVLLSKADQSGDAGTPVEQQVPGSSEIPLEDSNMSTTAQPTQAVATLSDAQVEQIKATAAKLAAEIVGKQNSEGEVAKTIANLTTAAETAKATAADLQKKLEDQNKAVADLQKAVEDQKSEAAKFKKAADDKEQALEDEKKKYGKAKADLDEANKKLVQQATASAIVSRKAEIATANIKADSKFAAKAVATSEDGSLKMSDEDFKDGVEDMKQPAAPVANAEQKPATEGEKKDEQPATQATASKPAAAAPAAPDLSNVGMYQQAAAALANGAPAPSQGGVSKYAAAFKE